MKYLIFILVFSLVGCSAISKHSEYKYKKEKELSWIKVITAQTVKMDDCQGSMDRYYRLKRLGKK